MQEAFAAGLIKPGLNTILAPKDSSKPKTNNVEGLKQKLDELQQKLPWIERLDMVNKPAPLAPELGKDIHGLASSKLGSCHLFFSISRRTACQKERKTVERRKENGYRVGR